MGIIFEQAEMSDMSGSKNKYFIFMLSWIWTLDKSIKYQDLKL